ncbi:hypothetical protein CORC01_05265 [Colletotrichum orchidophilum]|uniref:Uncharacterized protein n=1 Tax=Colletotrichum orchidophilum TaxID=1209926 RepID=A0A1G4BDR9_9PEZI|nr:uncharacterized protein CORC01_05265 [Colletotrichum orchidophilum]OHE99465.1 hypothetical protein CORC01_05265 [Colletotrichum orchidophilum]
MPLRSVIRKTALPVSHAAASMERVAKCPPQSVTAPAVLRVNTQTKMAQCAMASSRS